MHSQDCSHEESDGSSRFDKNSKVGRRTAEWACPRSVVNAMIE